MEHICNREQVREGLPQGEKTKQRSCALVTGSSRGIGKAIARVLAEDGNDICLNYAAPSSEDAAQDFARELEERFDIKAIAFCADVSDADQAEALINHAVHVFGNVDILVNNAGITKDGLIARMKTADFDSVIDVNLKGAFNCCKCAAKFMMKRRYGRIINMGSIVGVNGNAGQANYAASKAGLIGLTKSLAAELAPRNITANVIAPGFIETDMTDALSESQQERMLSRIAARRFGAPEEVASLAAFLASDKAAYITGQVIGIDGGMA